MEEAPTLVGIALPMEEVPVLPKEGVPVDHRSVHGPTAGATDTCPAPPKRMTPGAPRATLWVTLLKGVTPLLEEVSALLKEKALLLKGTASRLEEVPA